MVGAGKVCEKGERREEEGKRDPSCMLRDLRFFVLETKAALPRWMFSPGKGERRGARRGRGKESARWWGWARRRGEGGGEVGDGRAPLVCETSQLRPMSVCTGGAKVV